MQKDFPAASAPGIHTEFYPPSENPPPYSSSPSFQPGYGSTPQASYPYPMSCPPQPGHTVVQMVAPFPAFGSRPANTRCPFCQEDIITKVKKRYSGATHLIACLLCCVCCCCFAWAPYVFDCMCEIEHQCPNCQKFLGVFQRTSDRRHY